MRRPLPSAADVRAAIADVRRALERRSAAPIAPEWMRGEGACAICGAEGAIVRTEAIALCDRTLAELAVAAWLPEGPHVEQVLGTVESWMHECDTPGSLDAGGSCSVCARAAAELPVLVGAGDVLLCSDCISAALARVDPVVRDEVFATEAEAAIHELTDLERLAESQGAVPLRANPTVALSLVRMLSIHDERAHEKLATLVRVLG